MRLLMGRCPRIGTVPATQGRSAGRAPWWAARTLAERAADAPRKANAAGRRRRDTWRAGFAGDDLLAARIGHAGIADEDALAAALSDGAPPADAQAPEWWALVERALEAQPGDFAPEDAGDRDAADPRHGGRWIAARFAAYAHSRLAAHPDARDDAVDPLARGLVRGLAAVCRCALAVELEAARLVDGWAPEEAVERAAELMRGYAETERARDLLASNPGLARLVADRTALAIAAGLELLDRLRDDLPRVREQLLDGAGASAIAELTPLGDRHDGGRRVLRLRFEDGARVMLKPRALDADVAYGRLLSELNALGFAPPFAPIATLASGPRHGWQACVEPAGCADEGAVERYFRRFGGQLAVLYALRATDLHEGNVIACGEHPMIVDLPTLLQPRLGAAAADTVDPLIGESAIDSVLRVGLLPRPDGSTGADSSAVGRDPDARAQAGDDGGTSKDAGGPVSLVDGPPPVEDAARVSGRPVRPHEHVDALARGFEDGYRLLVAHRARLLEPGGALAAFAGVEVRLNLRARQAYGFILQRQVTDDGCLQDGLAREAALDVLWRAARGRPDLRAAAPAEYHDLWRGDVPKLTARPGAGDLHHHALGRIAGALGCERPPGPEVVERLSEEDLARQLSFLRTAVLASAGEARPTPAPRAKAGGGEVPTALAKVDGDDAAARLAKVDRHDAPTAPLPPVGSLVRRRPKGSSARRAAPPEPVDAHRAPPPKPAAARRAAAPEPAGAGRAAPPKPPDARRLRRAAGAAAGRLAILALRDGDQAGWLTLVRRRAPRDGCVLAAAGADLADGQAGIALFLAALAPQHELTQAAIARFDRLLRGERDIDAVRRPGLRLAIAAIGDERLQAHARALRARDDGGAAAASAQRGAPDALLDVFAWSGLLRARPTGAARDELARAAATLAAGAGAEDGAAGRLAIAVALRGAGALLADTTLATRAKAVAAGAMDEDAWPHRCVETPGLRDGLAGIGLGCLALAQREPPAWMCDAIALSRCEPRRLETAQTSSRATAAAAAVRAPGATRSAPG